MEMISQEELSKEIQRLRPSLYRVSFGILKNDADAEDAVSETIIRAFEKHSMLKESGALAPWLFKILSNVSKDIYNRRKRAELMDNETVSAIRDNKGFECDIVDDVIRDLDYREVLEAVDNIDVNYRDVVKLYYFGGYSVSEISEALNISNGTVKSRLFRARRELRKLLSSFACIIIVFCTMMYTNTIKTFDDGIQIRDDGYVAGQNAGEGRVNKDISDGDVTLHKDIRDEEREEIEEAMQEHDLLSAVLIVNNESEIDRSRVCYVISKGKLYIPDRILTDDEEKAIQLIKEWEKTKESEKTNSDDDSMEPAKKEVHPLIIAQAPSEDDKKDGTTECSANVLSGTRRDEIVSSLTERFASSGEKTAVTELDQLRPSISKEDIASYVALNEDIIADYDTLFSGKTRPDSSDTFDTTEEMIAKRLEWRQKWIDAERYDDTIPFDESDDIDFGEAETGEGEIKQVSPRHVMGENTVITSDSLEHLEEIVGSKELVEKYAVECAFDPDAPYGVGLTDERERTQAIYSFAYLGIPESGRIYIIDLYRDENGEKIRENDEGEMSSKDEELPVNTDDANCGEILSDAGCVPDENGVEDMGDVLPDEACEIESADDVIVEDIAQKKPRNDVIQISKEKQDEIKTAPIEGSGIKIQMDMPSNRRRISLQDYNASPVEGNN